MSFSLVILCFVLVGVLGFVLFSEHPISVGFWFILYSTLAALCVGLDCSSYFGYLLFFVYVGALLVMFCMVVSLTPNPVFRVVPFVGLMPFVVGGGVNMFEFKMSLGLGSVSEDMDGGLYWGLGEYDGLGWGSVLVWLGLILLLSVISVASMCKRSSGPLVRFNLKKGSASA